MKKATFYLLGLLCIAFGATCIYTANIGIAAWDTVFLGLHKHFKMISIGTWIFIVGSIMMVINKILTKEKLDIAAFVTLILVGFLVDFFLKVVFHHKYADILHIQLILFSFGFLLLSLGVALYVQPSWAINPIDKSMISVHKRFGLSVKTSRTICEVFALILGIILGGPVSYGTVFIAVCIGPTIQILMKPVKKVYEKLG